MDSIDFDNVEIDALAFLIVSLILVVIIWLLLIGPRLYVKDQSTFGSYGATTSSGFCINDTGLCDETGIITISQPCVPNSITGRGCLDENGFQTFSDKIIKQSCRPVCQKSIWLNEGITPCTVDNRGPTVCVTRGTTGTQTQTLLCIGHDTVGVNNCNTVQIVPIVGIGGVTGTSPQTITYQIGDTYNITSSCTNYPNPICP